MARLARVLPAQRVRDQRCHMRTRSSDAAPLLEAEEDGQCEETDGQCKHHRPSISNSSWMRTAGLAVGAAPQHGRSASLGSAPARLLRLLRARSHCLGCSS